MTLCQPLGGRTVPLVLTERELHAVCNAADLAAWIFEQRGDAPENWVTVRETTEKLRIAWHDYVTGAA